MPQTSISLPSPRLSPDAHLQRLPSPAPSLPQGAQTYQYSSSQSGGQHVRYRGTNSYHYSHSQIGSQEKHSRGPLLANNRQRGHVPGREYASKITPRGKGGYEWSETAMPDIVDAADRYVYMHSCDLTCRRQSVQARLTYV